MYKTQKKIPLYPSPPSPSLLNRYHLFFPMTTTPTTLHALLDFVSSTSWAHVKQTERHVLLLRTVLADCSLSKLHPSKLTQPDVARLMAALRVNRRPGPRFGEKIKPASWVTYLGILRKWINDSQALGLLPSTLKVKVPPRKSNRMVTISREEEQRIYDMLDAAADCRGHRKSREEVRQEFYRVGFGIMFMLETGVRISELLGLKAEDLVTRGDRHGVILRDTKSGKDRMIPLNTRAKEAWDLCLPYGLWTFNKRTPERNYAQFQWFWVRIHSVCNLPNEVVIHSLRHTYATRFIEAGGNVTTLKELLGHQNITQTMAYVHQSEEALFKEVERLETVAAYQTA